VSNFIKLSIEHLVKNRFYLLEALDPLCNVANVSIFNRCPTPPAQDTGTLKKMMKKFVSQKRKVISQV
jgi:hypothetical protein